ncbi:MAG: response regulator [Dyella sp.]
MHSGNSPRVLLVEDEPLVGMMIEDMLEHLGYQVVAVAPRLQLALELAAQLQFDLAMLDINLAGETSFPVADLLRQRGIPFFFVSGYGSPGLDHSHTYARLLRKPFAPRDLQRMLADALG